MAKKQTSPARTSIRYTVRACRQRKLPLALVGCVKTPPIRALGVLVKRKADSPSYCFSEKSSERRKRLEHVGLRPRQSF